MTGDEVEARWDKLDDHAFRAEVDGHPYPPWQLEILRRALTSRGVEL